MTQNKKRNTRMYVKTLVFSAVAIALAVVTSFIKLFELPMGGSVTLFSMFFVTLVGYWYGPAKGIIAAVVYGVLQFIFTPYFITVPQVICDYVLAFGALGLSGFFNKMKYGLQIGYLVSIFGRFVFAWLSGVLFFAAYADGSGYAAPVYSLLYNGSYIGLEGIVTLIILFIPPVSKALSHVKNMAVKAQ